MWTFIGDAPFRFISAGINVMYNTPGSSVSHKRNLNVVHHLLISFKPYSLKQYCHYNLVLTFSL